jgi:hypothetical protein
MQATEDERELLISLYARGRAIDAMFERCVVKQQELEQDFSSVMQTLRVKHKIPADQEFTVTHDTGAITIIDKGEGGSADE